jgi:hypothetical protein
MLDLDPYQTNTDPKHCFKQLRVWFAGAGGEAGLVAGVSRAYSRPAHHQEEQEDSTNAADDTSLEDLMAQMKSI